MLLGVPFNMASYAILLALVAHYCDYDRGELILTFGDCHIYNNQREGL
jgi:thymidylate synthase